MNIKEQEENIIDIKSKDEKNSKEEETNLLNKKRLRYNKVVKNNII
jgi:hypothetical protein